VGWPVTDTGVTSRRGDVGAWLPKMSAGAPAFRPAVKADGSRPGSGGPVLLLDVLAQDRDGGASGRPGEVRPGPQPVCPPVMPGQVRKLLPDPAGRHALEAVDQSGQGGLGREAAGLRWNRVAGAESRSPPG
jgi:hypothetical protein